MVPVVAAITGKVATVSVIQIERTSAKSLFAVIFSSLFRFIRFSHADAFVYNYHFITKFWNFQGFVFL